MRYFLAVLLALSCFVAELNDHRLSYERQLAGILADSESALQKLATQYNDALKSALAIVQQKGDLDATLALKAEIKRFAAERDLPRQPASASEVARLQGVYRRNLRNIELDEAKQIVELTHKYDAALLSMEKRLVTANRVDAAVNVREERESRKAAQVYVDALAVMKGASRESALKVRPLDPSVKAIASTLMPGKRIATNRNYTFGEMPEGIAGLNVLVMGCRQPGGYEVEVPRSTRVLVLVNGVDGSDLVGDGWRRTTMRLQMMLTPDRPAQDRIAVYEKVLQAGKHTIKNKGNWPYMLVTEQPFIISK